MLSIVVFSVLSISMLAEVLSSIKLCGLEFHLQEESLILLKKQEKYNINKEDSKVLYCMMGWLIVWPSGEKINVLLLRKGFLGTQSEKLGLYFKSKMNYISSKKERQETLKKLGINRLNPIKYIKWPA
ncbi:MAG: hypothetical protein KAS23_14080 [Anaerohalosphaera sp.]|nr:hypothetical protein [Anaerohalosphaera sp.]